MLKVFKILPAKSSVPFYTRTVLDKKITVLDKRILEKISESLSPFVFRFVYRFSNNYCNLPLMTHGCLKQHFNGNVCKTYQFRMGILDA